MAAKKADKSRTDSLMAFAADLRNLRMAHIAEHPRRYYQQRDIDSIANSYRISRSAIYAACSGKTLPQVRTLLAMLKEWDRGGAESHLRWLKRRDELQRQLAQSQLGRGGRPLPPPPDEHARALRGYMQELHKESHGSIRHIAEAGGGSPVTLAAALRGPHLPSWNTLEAFLTGLQLFDEDYEYEHELDWDDPAILLKQNNSETAKMRGLWMLARDARRATA